MAAIIPPKSNVKNGGTLVGSEKYINLIQGANVTLTTTDNTGTGAIDVTIAAAASSGMTNPLTTTGDIIYSSSGSTPSRLGIGTSNQVLTVVAGVPAWVVASGSATPAGLTTQIQFNNAAAFGASANFTWDNTNNIIGISGTNAASSLIQKFVNLTPTINQTGTAGWTGVFINVTETANGSGTRNLIDLQVGGSSQFTVSRGGSTTVTGPGSVSFTVKGQGGGNASFNIDRSSNTNFGQIGFATNGTNQWNFGPINNATNDFQLSDAINGNILLYGKRQAGLAIGIGISSPTAYLHIKAGVATANGSPFKLTSGVNLTTAEAGAEEYDGTSRYFTPGTVRKRYRLIANGTNATSGAAATIDWSSFSDYSLILTANCTLTFTSPGLDGDGQKFTLSVIQDATGSRTITWPASVVWAGGTPPSLTATANYVDEITFKWINSISKYRAAFTNNFSA